MAIRGHSCFYKMLTKKQYIYSLISSLRAKQALIGDTHWADAPSFAAAVGIPIAIAIAIKLNTEAGNVIYVHTTVHAAVTTQVAIDCSRESNRRHHHQKYKIIFFTAVIVLS